MKIAEAVENPRSNMERVIAGEFPSKPKERCTLGREILLKTNHCIVMSLVDLKKHFPPSPIYFYDVKVTRQQRDGTSKDVDSKNLMKYGLLLNLSNFF